MMNPNNTRNEENIDVSMPIEKLLDGLAKVVATENPKPALTTSRRHELPQLYQLYHLHRQSYLPELTQVIEI